jgi:hypothetical protein
MMCMSSGVRKYKINQDFFSEWNSQMAYILGFSCADGNVYERTLSWELSNKSKSNFHLLESFNVAMESEYPIKIMDHSYRLRISHQCILHDIKQLGIIPNKKKVLICPTVPEKYISHFIRGFLDGDGWVVTRIRKNGGKEICVGFSNGSYEFMKEVIRYLGWILGFKEFNLRKREKITKNGKNTLWYQLEFYSNSAYKLLNFLYGSLGEDDLFLKRKYEKFLEAKNFFQEEETSKFLGRKAFNLKEKFKRDPREMINTFLLEDNLIPREIASKLGISLSTLYRWMDRCQIRTFAERGSKEWSQRIKKSKGFN